MDEIKDYPEEGLVSVRSGIKVGWRTYATEEQAKACAVIAKHNARIYAGWGYDFGYRYPSEIVKIDAGYEVTIP